MFLQTWTNSAWTPEEEEDAQSMLTSELLPVNDLCLFISAVTLSLMECFDLRRISVKVCWDAYRHPDVQCLAQRALVGVIFIFHIYKNRLSLYNDLVKRVDLMDEISPFKEDVARISSPNVTMPGNGKDRQENERGNHSPKC